MLLATTGLRRAELARLTPADVRRVDSSSLSLSVTTKGGRQLMVAVPAGVDAVLEQWADTVRAERGASASLWSRDGVPFSDGQIGCIVSAAGAQAGLPKGLSTPHALRRTFATLSALSGVDLRELQSALGHSHATTTEHYVRSALPAARAPGEAVLRALEGEQPAKGEQSGTT
jgi:site-specific recombinase XerD